MTLARIGSFVKDGGNLIFTGCRAGGDGGFMGKQMQRFLGSRFNIYLNTVASKQFRWEQNSSDQDPSPVMFNRPLQDNSNLGGFIKITPNGEVINLGETLQFNSKGHPVTPVIEDDPDPGKYNVTRRR